MVEADPRGLAYMQAFTVAKPPKVVNGVNGYRFMELSTYCLEAAAEPNCFRPRRKAFRIAFDDSGTELPLSTVSVVPISHSHARSLEYPLLERGKQVWNCRHKKMVSYRERSRDPGNLSVSFL